MNEFLKNKMKWKNKIYKDYVKNGKTENLKLQIAINDAFEIIDKGKNDYNCHLASKLNNPKIGAKIYWSILKSFYSGKKISLIPPLLHNNTLKTDFKQKADLFNNFIASQCTTFANNSVIPDTQSYKTNSRLSSLSFENDDILNLIRFLNIQKAHGSDDISIRMIKICNSAPVQPLSLIFQNCLNCSTFPDIWKKSNICPVHKKNDKQIISNFRPVSLLPVFGKIFEKLIFKSLFEYLNEDKLLSEHQSGFKPNDSCTNQLLSIVHDIYTAFDDDPALEVRGVFLDMSKAFDKVWHEGLIYKLSQVDFSGEAMALISNFLNNRFQRAILN